MKKVVLFLALMFGTASAQSTPTIGLTIYCVPGGNLTVTNNYPYQVAIYYTVTYAWYDADNTAIHTATRNSVHVTSAYSTEVAMDASNTIRCNAYITEATKYE